MDTITTENRRRSGASHEPSATLKRLLRRVPEETRDSFTPEQLAALDAALDFENPTRHPLNLRMTLLGWAYLVIQAGRERRGPARSMKDRRGHPLNSPGNILFLIGVVITGLIVGHSLHTLLIGN